MLLDRHIDLKVLMSHDDHENNSQQEITQLCLQVMETVRFEKERVPSVATSRTPTDLSVSFLAVISGVLHSFDVIDMDDEEQEEIPSLPNGQEMEEKEAFITLPPDITTPDTTSEAAVVIQQKWRASFEYNERKREKSMQESLARGVIKVIIFLYALYMPHYVGILFLILLTQLHY